MSPYRASCRSWVAGLLVAGSVLLLILGPRAAMGASPLRFAAQTYPAGIFLNEFMPDPASDWNDDGTADQRDEYIELYNANDFDVDISGWILDDIAGGGTAPHILPANTVLRAQRHLVLFGSETRIELNNGGDTVRLLTPDGTEVESYAYASSLDDQAYSKTVDGGSEWTRTYPPSPGASNQPPPPPTATPTPTQGPTPTPYPTGISLNEYLPRPASDWNGDGAADADDEYIELHNGNAFAVDISGWKLDDLPGSGTGNGSPTYTLPPGTWIPASGFLVFFRSQTGVALNDTGDSVTLMHPDGSIAEITSYPSGSAADQAYSKTVDGGDQWTNTYLPSPGASNQPPPPTATPTSTPSATATPTATSAASPTPYPGGVSLNEYLPDPDSDWNGNGTADLNDEYIELYNANDFTVNVSGWRLDDVDDELRSAPDGSPPYALPPGTYIPARGFLLVFRSQSGLALNNDGDWVRLLYPDGSVVEETEYTSSRNDEAYSKTADGGSQWTRGYPPSPGTSNQPAPTATPSPTVPPTSGAISGHVFLDPNQNGRFEPWLGETGLADVLVMLSNGRSRLSGPNGWYGFANLPPGPYSVRQAQPVHTGSTTPDEVTLTLAAGDVRDDVHFGEIVLPLGQVQSPVLLNEFLPSPISDWDGNGVANAEDEWIELYNRSDAAVDLGGWWLDDMDDGLSVHAPASPLGSQPYMLPPGTIIPARGFLVVYRSTSRVALNNDGDSVRLLGPALYPAEAVDYNSTGADVAWGKTVDGGNEWTSSYPPSPGSANGPSETPTPGATPPPNTGGITINEYLPDPASDWNGDGTADLNDEYIELHNANPVAVSLAGWSLDDLAGGGSAPYIVPAGVVIPGGGFALFFRSDTGLALNNDGDSVRLLGPGGVLVEDTAYTTSSDDLAYSKTVDGGSEWTSSYPPSPGASNQPDSTPTPTPTPTATPGAFPDGVSLNEYLPDPASDWNGDGTADLNDEYIEIHNSNAFAVDLSGWRLDDVDDGAAGRRFLFGPDGSPPYTLPTGTTIPAGGFLLVFRSQSGVALNNEGDWVRLLRPDGVVAESTEYTSSRDDQAYSKTMDGGDQWTTAYPPSPGASNQPGNTPTPTPTATATPTATPAVYPGGLSLNEYLPDPASDWNGDGVADLNDEYIELHNANPFTVDLGGWRLDDVDDGARTAPDGSPPYSLPEGTTIPAGGFLLIFRSQSSVALNNEGDWVRLLRPDGMVVEETQYSSSRNDVSYSKTVDGGDQWTTSYLPSPGASNQTGIPPTPTPVATTVRLNELLPSPRDVDWDGNGVASYLDEWIELHNLGNEPVDLGGWMLADGQPTGAAPDRVYVLPAGASVPSGGYLVIFRAQSGLGLDASREWLRLLYPDGSEADAMSYNRFSGYDQSWCRLPDGTGGWTTACSETPGQPNQPGSGGSSGGGGSAGGGGQPYDRFNYDLATIARARSLPDGTRLTLEGQVTVLPNIFDDQEIYIQDNTGGIRIYLRSAEWPPLSEGQWVRVNGRLGTFYGERQMSLVRIDDIKTMQPGAPLLPQPIRTGQVSEDHEGRLVLLSAPITGFWQETTLYLDDGSGEARVTIKAATGVRRPYVDIGEMWTVAGVVSESESGYRVLPRRQTDIQQGRVSVTSFADPALEDAVQEDMAWNAAPLFLPVTGEVLTVRLPAGENLRQAWYQAVRAADP